MYRGSLPLHRQCHPWTILDGANEARWKRTGGIFFFFFFWLPVFVSPFWPCLRWSMDKSCVFRLIPKENWIRRTVLVEWGVHGRRKRKAKRTKKKAGCWHHCVRVAVFGQTETFFIFQPVTGRLRETTAATVSDNIDKNKKKQKSKNKNESVS